ncbi:MAG: DUF6159 family protein [Planctomycetaceae bacterium]|nr:DUF6159 family protein [Planctomycetaceae bacterium]
MVSKFQRSWALLKCSVQVVGMNKRLLLFPLLFFVFTLVIIAFFLLPILFVGTGHAFGDPAHWKAIAHRWLVWRADGQPAGLTPAGYVVAVAAYLVSTFLATFFNVAFYSQIINALRGSPVSIVAGLRLAASRWKAILLWSLLTGVVGLVIRAIEERVGIVGRWIVGLIGMAWSVASLFVAPIIVMEPESSNPLQSLKTSALLLRKTWGESLLGYVGIRFGELLIFLGSIVLLVGGVVVTAALHIVWVMAIVFVVWLLSLLAFMYLTMVASQVFLGALYVYAAEGIVPGPFNREQMDVAWRRKRGG